jgi:hypothetical protein
VQNAWGKVKDAVRGDEHAEEPKEKKPAA